MTSRTRLPFLSALLVLGVLLAGCGPFGGNGNDDRLRTAVSRLAHQIVVDDVSMIAFTEPGAEDAFARLWKPLAPYDSEITSGDPARSGDTATAELSWVTNVPGGVWKRTTSVSLVRSGTDWKVVWAPSILESSLAVGESLTVTGIKAERGKILGNKGQPLVEPRAVVRFGIDKTQVPGGVAAASATRLANLLDLTPAPFVKAVDKAGPKAFVQAVVLRRADVSSSLLGQVDAVPGARSISDHLPLAPTRDFAAAILGTVGAATAELIKKSGGRLHAGDDTGLSGLQLRYDEHLSGTPGVTIAAQAPTPSGGSAPEPRVLFTQGPTAGEPLTITLDKGLQTEAQQLLERYGPASALVAIKPSTGEILAAASGPGSKGYNTATFGQYAPGSTFKVVSSLALLRSGLTPTSNLTCPATVDVNGKQFKNYSDYPSNRLGTITLRDAVANSCNTAFISSRSKVKGTALAEAAAALGFGVDHDLGFPAYFGQVPAAKSETEAAADLIGQGKVLASPMAMAAVVASVVHSSTVVPRMVDGVDVAGTSPAVPLTAAEAASLRALMRAVVTDGSGSFLGSLPGGPVIAKTGTAEFGSTLPLRTHTWMVGAQGDLAVAVFVDVGQSGSRTAGPVLEAFLRAAR